MRRILFTLAVVFLTVSALPAQAQEAEPAVPLMVPAAVRSQSDCTGFIAEAPVPHDLFVLGGADDDFHSVVRQFVQGDDIFLSQHGGAELSVGAEFNVVRPASELFRTFHYPHQGADIAKLGKPYEDVAKVRVTQVNPDGVVAKVLFSCEPVVRGDNLVPFQPRAIPEYAVTRPLNHFIPLDEHREHGRIIATHNNFGFLGQEMAIYVDLGARNGAVAGKRLRIYKILPPESSGGLGKQRTPPETVGEAIVLSVQSGSCVAMVVSSYREISAGDYIETE